MNDEHGARLGGFDALARDWITLWQSELAGMAFDREAQESWQAGTTMWANAAIAMLEGARAERPLHDSDQAGTADAARAAAAAAAPDPGADAGAGAAPGAGGDDIQRLRERLDGIERRLAGMERRRIR